MYKYFEIMYLNIEHGLHFSTVLNLPDRYHARQILSPVDMPPQFNLVGIKGAASLLPVI